VDEFPQGALISAKAVGCIETPQPKPAKRATPIGIERGAVLKGGAAGGAKMVRCQWFGSFETSTANGNPGYFEQRLVTDPAVVGEEK
jgi:hypothetical protein